MLYILFFFTFEISFYGINLLYSTSLLPKWSISPKPFPANSICLPLKMPPITGMFPYPIVPSLFAVVWIVCYLTTQLHLITPSFWKYPSLTFLFTIIFWFFTRFICHFSFSFVSSFFLYLTTFYWGSIFSLSFENLSKDAINSPKFKCQIFMVTWLNLYLKLRSHFWACKLRSSY